MNTKDLYKRTYSYLREQHRERRDGSRVVADLRYRQAELLTGYYGRPDVLSNAIQSVHGRYARDKYEPGENWVHGLIVQEAFRRIRAEHLARIDPNFSWCGEVVEREINAERIRELLS